MAYIDCDKCSHGCVCAYRHQYDDQIVTCSHWQPVDEGRKFTNQKIVSELDGADVFLRGRAASKSAPLNEYDIEVLLGIANICAEAADTINRQKAEIDRLNKLVIEKHKEIDRLDNYIQYTRSDTIKEFAKRLCDGRVSNDPVVIAAEALLKELTEGAHYEVRKDLADL